MLSDEEVSALAEMEARLRWLESHAKKVDYILGQTTDVLNKLARAWEQGRPEVDR